MILRTKYKIGQGLWAYMGNGHITQLNSQHVLEVCQPEIRRMTVIQVQVAKDGGRHPKIHYDLRGMGWMPQEQLFKDKADCLRAATLQHRTRIRRYYKSLLNEEREGAIAQARQSSERGPKITLLRTYLSKRKVNPHNHEHNPVRAVPVGVPATANPVPDEQDSEGQETDSIPVRF